MEKNTAHSEFTDLISTLSTKRDLNNLLSQLEELERGIFRKEQDVEKFISEQLPARVASDLVECARAEQMNLSDPSAATEFFKSLRKRLADVSVVRLRVAFEPTRAQLGKFASWFVENSTEPVVFEVKYDAGVIGGAVVEYKGKIGDFSLAKKLEGYFQQNNSQ